MALTNSKNENKDIDQTRSLATMTSTQKVAALLILLGPTTASEVLKNISDEDLLEQITLEIASLNKVPSDILTDILEEFRALFQASTYISSGGIISTWPIWNVFVVRLFSFFSSATVVFSLFAMEYRESPFCTM